MAALHFAQVKTITMRTILIPTDFTSTPLLLLKYAAVSSHEKLNVIFMYSTFLSDSITDLLFYSPQKTLQDAIPNEFREGCSIMQNKYPEKIYSIRYEIFHSNSASAFRILAEMNQVDLAFIAVDDSFRLLKNEFNPTRVMLKSGLPVEEVSMQTSTRVAEKDLIAQLLTS